MINVKSLGMLLVSFLAGAHFLYAEVDTVQTEGCPIAEDIYADSCWSQVEPESDCEFARRCNLYGIWLPEGPPLFRPFIADPRQITYSVGWRFNDQAIGKNVIDVSYGDTFPVYRWCNVWNTGGDLQLEVEGALWAVFCPLEESAPLVNADYYVGFPIVYSLGDLAFRLRGYHISSHAGDEYMIEHPSFERCNPSAEYLDFYVSYQFTQDIRLYGGVGLRVRQDESFHCSNWYAETGAELRLYELGYHDYCNRLYGEPFFAMNFRFQSDFRNHVDATYAIGYEWGKFSGLRRKLRIFLEYHDGYSVEGQFCKEHTSYLAIRATYGF